MFLIDWKFTLISLAFGPLCIIPTRIVTKKIKALSKADFGANIGQGNITIESFQNVRITKAYGLEEVHTNAFYRAAQLSARFSMKAIQSREMLNPIVQYAELAGP